MSDLQKTDDRIRTHHHSWASSFDGQNYFTNCITLDPRLTMSAWKKLSRDTLKIEVASYPALFHEALLATLKKHAIRR